ncbi:hypothetical protein APHAL10511_001436 [Amanita phalloides]|nr:hypothetical protein APHAL10511_001436 [Amanita phalloides]
MCTPVATLRSSLEKHNNTFEFLLKLIPAKFYIQRDDHHDEVSSKYLKHSQKTRAPKQAVKEVSKKARREKLDPANGEGTDVDVDMEDGGSEDGQDDNDNGGEDEDFIMPMPEPGGIEELRNKLHARIAELGKKGNKGEAADRDELLEERRRQRAAMRERRRKETKEKIRREAEAKGKKGKGKEVIKGTKFKVPLLVPDAGHVHDKPQDPQAKYTNVSYSNIAGAPQKGQHLKTTANPRQALEQMSARKEKLAGMPEEKRKAVEEKEKWLKAEAKMDGVKVRDNEARLKKAAKRKEKEKTKSKKVWGERKEQVAASMEARQKKRADNIAMRSERRKDKKSRKARPGFEGKPLGKAKGK